MAAMGSDDNEDAKSSLISINMSDFFGLGKASEKLSPVAIKVVEGLGKMLDPVRSAAKIYLDTRARSAADRHETKRNLQQISAVDRILAADPQLAEAMKARLISTEMRRQANIQATALRAVEIANDFQSDDPSKDLDQDFVQEWIEGVKDISSEEVQEIWARILAAAPRLPNGRVSKPALELLKQFDQPTANCFWDFFKLSVAVGF